MSHPTDGGSMILHNVGTNIADCMVWRHQKQPSFELYLAILFVHEKRNGSFLLLLFSRSAWAATK